MLVTNRSQYSYHLKLNDYLLPAGSSLTVDDSAWASDDQLARTIETLDYAGYVTVTTLPVGYPRTEAFPLEINIIGGSGGATISVGPDPPSNPENGALWYDTSEETSGEIPSEIYLRKVGEVTQNQLSNLQSVPITILDPPGDGKFVVPETIIFHSDAGSQGWIPSGGNGAIVFMYGLPPDAIVTVSATDQNTGTYIESFLLNAGSGNIFYMGSPFLAFIYNGLLNFEKNTINNAGFYLGFGSSWSSTGDFGLKYEIIYRILDVDLSV